MIQIQWLRNKKTRFLFLFILLFTLISMVFPCGIPVKAASKTVKKVIIYTGKKNVTKKTVKLDQGKSIKLKIRVTPSKAKKSIRYKTSSSKIAMISKGLVKAKSPGTCKITIIVKGKNGKTKKTWLKIKVNKKATTNKPTSSTLINSKNKLKILMIGNSYTSYNNLAGLLATRLNADVTSRTVGGASLAEHCETYFEDDTGKETLRILSSQKWDYVVIQEQSSTPFFAYDSFSYGAAVLCEKIRSIGATPVLYGTWAYKDGSTALTQTGYSHLEMYTLLHQAFVKVSNENKMILADVGMAFYQNESKKNLYASDGSHPSLEGSNLATDVIANAIKNDIN